MPFALLLAIFTGCVNPQTPIESSGDLSAQTTQAALATSITVPVPIISPGASAGVEFAFQSADFFGGTVYLVRLPLTSVPVGSTVTGMRARISGNTSNACWFRITEQTDFVSVTDIAYSSVSALSNFSQTLTLTANYVVPSLKPVYVYFGPNGFQGSCSLISMEATYTPAP